MSVADGEARTGAAAPDGPEVEVVIERIVPGGFGLGHAAGRTLFVAATAPGDRVRVRVDRTRGSVGFARVVEVAEASPARVAAPHPPFVGCGGCDFQHLTYDAQLAAKVAIVADCLSRIAKVEPPADLAIAPSPRRWGYRSRAEWRIDPERGLLGYLEQGSHRVCDVAHDPIVLPELDAALGDVRQRLAIGGFPAGTTEVRAAAGDDGISIVPPTEPGEPPAIVRVVGGERYAHDADCFFQSNPGVLAPLVAEVLRYAPDEADAPGERPAIDLYCGVGLFTLPLARRFGRVVGVEAHGRSAAFAARNATAAGLGGVRIETASVGRWLEGGWRSFGRPPLVVLDPPRTGLEPAALRALPRLRAERIAYVSCDPATLARDLKGLLESGYRLEGVAAFDMFPQTHHVEAVAHLARQG